MTIPQITPLPLPPTTQDIENFDERADDFLPAIVQAAEEMNQVVLFVNDAAMDVASMEGIRDDTYAARDVTLLTKGQTQQIKDSALLELEVLADAKILVVDGIRDDAAASASAAQSAAIAAGDAAGLPAMLPEVIGKPLTVTRDGLGVHYSEEFTPFITITSATTLVAGERYRVDTSAGGFNLTLPATPFLGATVRLFDGSGTWRKETPTLLRNGSLIMGLAEDMELNATYRSAELVYTDNKGWVLIL